MSTKPDAVRAALAELVAAKDAYSEASFADSSAPRLLSAWAAARAALAEQPAEPQCKAGGPCRFRGHASPALVEAHRAAEQEAHPAQSADYWRGYADGVKAPHTEGGPACDDGKPCADPTQCEIEGRCVAPHPAPSVAGPEGRVHELKTWTSYYAAVESGRKPFEVRLNDRDFRWGDVLRLREWSVERGDYTGRECWRTVTYVLTASEFCKEGFAILGLAVSPQPAPSVAVPAYKLWGYCAVLSSEGGVVWRTSRPTKRREVAEACAKDWSAFGTVLKADVHELFELAASPQPPTQQGDTK